MLRKFFVLTFLLAFVITNSTSLHALEQETNNKVVKIGESASSSLINELKKALKEALSSGSVEQGFSVCSEKAMDLTNSLEKGLPDGVRLKRVTNKHRNPANAPDKFEGQVLKLYEDLMSTGQELPVYHVQVQKDSNGEVYNYYKPLKVAGLCLNCHADRSNISNEVLTLIKNKYPNDLAHGYMEGDFRGLVKVAIPAAAIK